MSAWSSIPGFQQDLGCDHLTFDFSRDPVNLYLPAFDLSLILPQNRTCLLEPLPGRLDFGVGDPHLLLGEPYLLLVVDNSCLLGLPVLAQLGYEEVSEHVALGTLSPMSTFHFSMNALSLG